MKMHVSRSWLQIALIGAVGVFLLETGVALAATPSPDTTSEVVAAAVAPDQDGQAVVSAQFATSEGTALSDQRVSFFLQSDFLGGPSQVSDPREVFLGSATTDEAGTAQVHYTPTWDGTQRVVARLVGSEVHTSAEVTVEFDVAASSSGIISTHELPVLGQVREWTPVIVGAVVVAFWTILALVFLHSSQVIMAAGHRKGLVAQRSPIHAGTVTQRPRRR
ncbi:MAG: hypothetical protein HW388_1071 [Dehalococcoidia bacterium]|nr:hypothetical protein [Dehalococcoidia bacterium]